VAARDLAAFAFIPPGKKNSRGAWRLRQIEVGYNMLQQVRRGVTERRRAYATPPGRPGGAELISDASGRREIFPDANQVERYLRLVIQTHTAYRREIGSSGWRQVRVGAAHIT
jgi:hypothetical protein